MGDDNYEDRLFGYFFSLALGVYAPAKADPSEILLMFGGDDEFGRAANICKSGEPSDALPACNLALLLNKKSGNKKFEAYLLLKRSNANLRVRKFTEAIADADNAGKILPGSVQLINQRCWARAVANREIARARSLCMEYFDKNGASAPMLTSLALVEMRDCNWYAAGMHYHAAYLMDNVTYADALYAMALTLSARKNFVAPSKFPYEDIMEGNLQHLTADQIAKAQAKYAALGLSYETLVPGKTKCPARPPKSEYPSRLPSFDPSFDK